ncbi:hypothetical protein MHYP_G00243120 [Metynnis hypsauchen]
MFSQFICQGFDCPPTYLTAEPQLELSHNIVNSYISSTCDRDLDGAWERNPFKLIPQFDLTSEFDAHRRLLTSQVTAPDTGVPRWSSQETQQTSSFAPHYSVWLCPQTDQTEKIFKLRLVGSILCFTAITMWARGYPCLPLIWPTALPFPKSTNSPSLSQEGTKGMCNTLFLLGSISDPSV